jgi:hypothetical protein
MSGPKNPPPQPQVSPSSPTKTNLCKIPSAAGATWTEFCTASDTPVKFSHYPIEKPCRLPGTGCDEEHRTPR